jgi:TonB family protein
MFFDAYQMRYEMKKILVGALVSLFLTTILAALGFGGNEPIANQTAHSVTLVAPFISTQTGELSNQISVQDAIGAVAEQAGLRYDWKTSLNNTVPIITKLIRPDVRNQSWQESLEQILKPLDLTYKIASNKIVIDKTPALQAMSVKLTKSVTLVPPYNNVQPGEETDRISVQFAVRAIASQLGLEYNWEKSAKNLNVIARQWTRPNIRNRSGQEALEMICKPLNLLYWVESGKIVLDTFPAPPNSAMEAWIKAANRGNARVQGILGQRYYSGTEGMPQDYSKAMKWLIKAAENGDYSAQFALGEVFTTGKGAVIDYVKAYKYMYLAAVGYKEMTTEVSAARNRDAIAAKMTPQRLENAQALAKDWISGFWRKAGNGPYLTGWGVASPEPLVQPSPAYTPAARQANVQGVVVLQCVIRKNGIAEKCKLIKGLGYGLDESAANIISTQWRFKPGLKEGAPVDVIINIEILFK